jgi:hypothetical protein
MKKELQDYLYKKYPKLFIQKDLPMTKTCMCWGICFEKGWFRLLDILCGQIQHIIDNHNDGFDKGYDYYLNKGKIQQVEFLQLKEKFGGLRAYYNGGNDEIAGMIRLAEEMSYHICEYCGTMDNIGCTSGWIKTICRDCFIKSEKEKDPNFDEINIDDTWQPNNKKLDKLIINSDDNKNNCKKLFGNYYS